MVNEYGALNPMAYQQMMLTLIEHFMTENGVEVPTLISRYGVSWVLLSMTVGILSRIRPGERLSASIWNVGRRGVVFRRDVRILHADGSEALLGAQFYSILDMQTRRISRDESVMRRLELDAEEEALRAESRASYDPARFSFRHTRHAHPSWIDELGHTNNSRYGEISYDAVSEEKRRRFRDLARMEIYFMRELRRGEQVEIRTAEEEDAAEVLGVSMEDGRHSFYTLYRYARP